MAHLLTGTTFRGFTDDGVPLVGGKLWTYASGTTTPQPTYADAALTTPNTNPITLNARGEAEIWLDPTKIYTLHLAASTGATVGTDVDDIQPAEGALSGTGLGQGASRVGMYGGGTVQDAISAVAIKPGGGDDRAALAAADAVAAARGVTLILAEGAWTIGSSIAFSARVEMRAGAQITTPNNTVYIRFLGGFSAPLTYCLNVDGYTQFFKTECIYPQWFGATGLFANDNTTAIARAMRACAGGMPAVATPNGMPDAQYPCSTVKFTGPGVYRVSGVPIYSGTTLDFVGNAGSPNGTAISQITNLVPAFYVCPINVNYDGTIINAGVGQNYINGGKYFSEIPASASEGEPIFSFLSPAQAYTQLGLTGTPGSIGHIDTVFRRVWALNCNTFSKATAGALWVHFEDGCQFDVARRVCYHTGTSYGQVSSIGTKVYAATWGAFTWDSTDATTGYRLDVLGGEIKAGNTSSTDANQRRSININSTAAPVAGTFCKIIGTNFLTTTISGVRHGGPIFVKNGCESVYIDAQMYDADSTNNQKFYAIQDGVKHLTIKGRAVSKSIATDAAAVVLQFSQATQTLTDINLDLSIVNESATAYSLAIGSNFAITGVDLDRVMTSGAFTALSNANVQGRKKPVNTVASAATIALPPNGEVFLISGTTTITSITSAGWEGRLATLIFQGALTLTDGLNLKLGGNFVTTADDAITLVCDGTNWYQTAVASIN